MTIEYAPHFPATVEGRPALNNRRFGRERLYHEAIRDDHVDADLRAVAESLPAKCVG